MIKMKKIIFDTNFLIDLARFRIDIDEAKALVGPCQFLTIEPVLKELKRIASKKTRSSRSAKVALKLIDLKKIKIIKTEEKNTDQAILKLANKETVVATNDKNLRKALKKKRVKTIYLRKKKHLAIN